MGIWFLVFSPVFLRSLRNFFTSGYQDFSQSLISLIIISMALDHITLQLWLSWLVNNISEGFENNKYTVGVFRDVKKAFDTIACFVFSHFNSLLPTPVSSILHFNSEYHDYMTRARFSLHKTCHTYQFAITWQAPIIWNDIPLTLSNSLTVSNFKKKLRLQFSE